VGGRERCGWVRGGVAAVKKNVRGGERRGEGIWNVSHRGGAGEGVDGSVWVIVGGRDQFEER